MVSPVLLHGFTGSSASWGGGLLDALSSAGLPPVLVDAPGHGARSGETDPAAFTLERVEGLVEEAAGPGPVPLVGYSMGGRLALACAVRRPHQVSALVLESSSPGLARAEERADRRASDEALARRLEEEGMESFVDFWESLPLFASREALPAEVRYRQRALRLANDPRSLAASLRGLGTGALPSFWEALPGLALPVLLLVGGRDRKFGGIARRMAERLPDAEVVTVRGAGHTVHLERPEAWLEAVVEFLRKKGR
jgi:2-succinyl-6-hydroxy-2,4-cyclohexadiene-1-carboxylate synthase